MQPGLVAFVRLLVFDFEWSRAQKKGKLPTTMLDKKVGEVLEKIITDREEGYGQSIQVSSPCGSSHGVELIKVGRFGDHQVRHRWD